MSANTTAQREPSSPQQTGLKKSLGVWSTLTLGVGAMVGFGWVTLVGGWIESAGSLGATFAFIVGGIMIARKR